MKALSFVLRRASLLLILVFMQKSGTGILLHSLLHTGVPAAKFPENQNDNEERLGDACSCIEDCLMPCIDGEEKITLQPVVIRVIPFFLFNQAIPFRISVYYSLRAPPASIL